MFERDIPDRECLELGISGADATLILMIELGETGCHLSASRPWSCDDYERFGGLDIVVPSVSSSLTMCGMLDGYPSII